MFSNVKYPYFSGTSVPRDFVEFPSQVNEMWADNPVILKNYAKHYQNGSAMPQALLDKVLSAAKFNQGFATTEYLGAAMLDQRWHQIGADLVPALIQHGRTQVLGGGEALIELGRRQDLVQQRLRHRRTVLVVLGVVLQDDRVVSPHLVDLRGELDEVTRHRGTREVRVLHVGEHAVQGVAELCLLYTSPSPRDS